ncbi:MAG: hypothetical protein JO259_12300 [Mycobacterium sp.]|nr:hypothetical protein [Mycobacterium sp.]
MDRTKAAGNGSVNNVPWASVFDPAANARALSVIQAEGFRAASEILDRFVGMVGDGGERPPTANREAVGSTDPYGPAVGAVGALEQLTRAWWATIGQLLLRQGPGAAQTSRDSATLDLGEPNTNGQLRVALSEPGLASGELWLHNRGHSDLGSVRLRCSDLLTHESHRIDSHAVHFDPEMVPMPARSSRGVTVKIAVPPNVQAGPYRGMVLVTGHPDVWLPVVFTPQPVR